MTTKPTPPTDDQLEVWRVQAEVNGITSISLLVSEVRRLRAEIAWRDDNLEDVCELCQDRCKHRAEEP